MRTHIFSKIIIDLKGHLYSRNNFFLHIFFAYYLHLTIKLKIMDKNFKTHIFSNKTLTLKRSLKVFKGHIMINFVITE